MNLSDPLQDIDYVAVYESGLVPLYVSISSLVWVIHDYFITVDNEIHYIWSQRMNFAKAMFLWIRYYTIVLVVLDVVQAHKFSRLAPTGNTICVLLNPISGMAGAMSLWGVQIVMQLRIYVLFNRSRTLAGFNAMLFIGSVGSFLGLLIRDTWTRIHFLNHPLVQPTIGCHPVLNQAIPWEIWLPAIIFEIILFAQALHKPIVSTSARVRLNKRISLAQFLLHDSLMYFFVIAFLLSLNMAIIGSNTIPWTGFGLFHAGIGIGTSRMMIELRAFSARNLEWTREKSKMSALHFQSVIHESKQGEDDSREEVNNTPSAENDFQASVHRDLESGSLMDGARKA